MVVLTLAGDAVFVTELAASSSIFEYEYLNTRLEFVVHKGLSGHWFKPSMAIAGYIWKRGHD